MASRDDMNHPRRNVPKPPYTESGETLDSGLGSSSGWIEFHTRYSVFEELEPPQTYDNDLAGIDLKSYMDYNDIPQYLDFDLGRTVDGLPEMRKLADAASDRIPLLNPSQLSKLKAQQEVDICLRRPFADSNGSQLPGPGASSDLTTALSGAFSCHMCKKEDSIYRELSSFKQHLIDMHDVQEWEYRCLEPNCTLAVPHQREMKEHMDNEHKQSQSLYQIAESRIELPCPTVCETCSQSTATWNNFYQHAKDHHLMQPRQSNLANEDKGKSSTRPRGPLEQKRKREDESTYTLDQNIPISRTCTRCSHNMANCGICCYLPESVLSCHICYNPPVFEMRTCVAAIESAYSEGERLFTVIRKKYHEPKSPRDLEYSLSRGQTEIQSLYDQHHQELGQKYEEGDWIAREQMKDIIITLQGSLLRHLRQAEDQGATLDLVALQIEAEQVRVRTLVIMGDLYRRLMGPFCVPGVLSMSIDQNEENGPGVDAGNAILLRGVDATLEQSLSPGGAEPQDAVVHQSMPLSLAQSSDSSTEFSTATNITSLEFEEDAIDAGIPTKNLDHILDAARYFDVLDHLELQTAQTLGMKISPYIELESQRHCIECLENCYTALGDLQSEGFCGTTISILIEDQDRHGVAKAFHVSLHQIGSLLRNIAGTFDEELLKSSTKRWMQKVLNVEDTAISDCDLVGILRSLCEILSIGLVSFSGSHVCRFDINLWDQEMERIPISLDGYTFKPRKLACLDEFIGGPAWILGKTSAPSGGMKISLTLQDLEQLWGPVSLVGGNADQGLAIQTERGFIVPLPREQQSSSFASSSLCGEIECHWVTEVPEYLFNENSDTTIPIRDTSRILIGTSTEGEAGLVVNEKCKSSMSLIGHQIACRLQYPGTSKSRYVSDGYDVQLVGGQYVTAGIMKKYKRIPKRTLKTMLIADCTKPDTKLVPLLNLRVRLEVSACTGNAQRVTLWDALRFSQTSTQPTDPPIYCTHKVGDKNCISSCWTRWQSIEEIDSLDHTPGKSHTLTGAEARRVIINAILALEHSGIDSDGNLQVSWPFSNSPASCAVLPSTPQESHNWFRVVKDTRDTSSFAVFSQRCLEFPEGEKMRSCSTLCNDNHFRPFQTILSTRILTPAQEGSGAGLLVGVRFLLGEVHLTVTKAMQNELAIIATVSMNPLNPLRYRLREILPDARAFDFKEHIWPDITRGCSVPMFIH